MKKVLSYIVLAGLMLLSIASCKRDEMAILDPASATAPALASFTVEENAIVAEFVPGSFKSEINKNVALSHVLVLKEVNGTQYNKTLNSKVSDNILTISRTDLCKTLMALGYEDGATVAIKMAIRATAQNPSQDNGINGLIESKSFIDIAAYQIYIPSSGGGPQIPQIDLSQYEEIPAMAGADTWGIIGPAVSDWSTDVDLKKISNDPEVWYAAAVPFVEDSFKFRGNDEWGDYDLGGGEYAQDTPIVMTKGGGDMTSAAGSFDVYLFPTYGIAYITVPGSGGSDLPDIDLSVYDYLDVMEGAETWGVIGPAVSDWSTDVDLEKISEDPEIWCAKDMPFQEDSFKFRGNDTWADYDLGGGVFAVEEPIVMTKGGGDMTAVAGNYDVYLYPTYGVAYLKPAGGVAPPPVPAEDPKVWSLIGTLGETSWDTDFDLENVSDNKWVIEDVLFAEGDMFKIRADHAWSKSYGGPEVTIEIPDGEGTKGVYEAVIGETFTAGSVDIYMPFGGSFTVTFIYDKANSTILIEGDSSNSIE